MAERPIPFQDFAVRRLHESETVSTWEAPYAQLLETAWTQLQDATRDGLSAEATAQLVHGNEDELSMYWLHQMTRDGFVQDPNRRDFWRLETDEEEVEIWFAGERGGAPHGYNAIHFTRRTETERSRAEFHYQHDPSEGLLLYGTNVYEGPAQDSVLSHELAIRRGTPDEGMAEHTFIQRYPTSRVYAEMVWAEGNPTTDADDDLDE